MPAMAKSWQYGRWRPVALQVVMWLIFASSLGLAAYIDHSRTASHDIVPGESRAFGRLTLRVPAGWDAREELTTPPSLVMENFDDQGRRRWTVAVTQEQQASARRKGPQYYLEDLLDLPASASDQVEHFSMLGRPDAALIAWRGMPEIMQYLENPQGIAEPGVYACVVLPDGLSVTVQVRGDGAYGPTARRLLRKMAENIRVADAPATKPAS